jgi:Kef-type K+ transport system membrane component KefB
LIVASIGLGLGVIGKNVYSVVVAMSILTTLLAPPFMRWAFSKPGQSSEGATSNSP